MYSYERALSEGDPRTNGWFLVSSPLPIGFILLTYVYFTIKGPKLMQNYKPLKLKYILVLYNFALVCLSVYMFKELLITSYLAGYSYKCQRVDYSNNPLALRMANVIWWFYFSKVIELFDTVFFIFRKKLEQITILHVYHHCTMLVIWWVGVKYVAGGQAFFPAMINSFIHMFMYAYYGLSVLGERVKPFLFWKRYLTQMQMVQFLAIIAHVIISLLNNCTFPSFMNYFGIFYCSSLTVLFLNYYIQTYIKKRHQIQIEQQQQRKNKAI